jgi:hypothetical protein
MALYATGARPNRPTEEIIKNALGEEDENGVPFEIIEVTSVRNEANYTSMHGCQDTFIEIGSEIPGKSFTISHRDEGRVRWLKGKFGGKPKAAFAKTEKNLDFLANHFYEGIFIFSSNVIKAEVEARAKKIKAAMTEEQKKKQEQHLQDKNTYMHGGPMPTRGGMTAAETEDSENRKNLDKRKRELDEQEQRIAKQEDDLTKRIVGATDAKVKVNHPKDELQAMNMGALKKLARGYYKLKIADTMKKSEIIDLIYEPEASPEPVVEQVTG